MTQEAGLSKQALIARPLVRTILGGACLAIFGGILVAGLWPFNPRPLNQVKWLTPANGLEFRRDGVIFTERPIKIRSSTEEQVSLDLWVQPAIDDTAPILSFDRPQPPEQFRVLQYGDTLLLQQKNGIDVATLEVEHSLNPGRSTFFTMTADRQRTSVYVNGELAKTSSHFLVRPSNLSGRLVAGSQPFAYDSWAGQLRGLAIYTRLFTANEALAHYQSWIGGKYSGGLNDAVALYRLDERQGKLVHNAAANGTNLRIPEAFMIVGKRFLKPPWPATFDRDYFQDVATNIAGFIPLGFCFCAFLRTRRIWPRISAPLSTIILGTALSLTIEVLQFYVPSRDSSLTDVITNTLGTVIGVILWQLTSRWLLAWLNPVDGTVQSLR